ncbi:MAG: YicC family protein [Coxiellaceae bacterium]|jgi:uncharacterized protein (TIGR00255 family)|nr:YicC family protein [Coxiellaceae bacterium]
MIQSMTAFARCSDQDVWGMATWEIRVVNHRYFDCSLKIPEVFYSLEANVRLQLQKALHRGRVDCNLRFVSGGGGANLMLNKTLVRKLMDMVTELRTYLPESTVDPMKILFWPHVLQTVEEDLTLAQEAVLRLFTKTLEELINTRNREGLVLAQLLKDKMQEILSIVTKIKEEMPTVLINQRQKIIKRLEEVITNLDQSRLEQEMVYFSQKVDITEEVDRLLAHANEVLRVLNDGGMVGKRLDFLMQELNREANTLASKSIDIETTQAAVELKVLIEQMREQVQNLV